MRGLRVWAPETGCLRGREGVHTYGQGGFGRVASPPPDNTVRASGEGTPALWGKEGVLGSPIAEPEEFLGSSDSPDLQLPGEHVSGGGGGAEPRALFPSASGFCPGRRRQGWGCGAWSLWGHPTCQSSPSLVKSPSPETRTHILSHKAFLGLAGRWARHLGKCLQCGLGPQASPRKAGDYF